MHPSRNKPIPHDTDIWIGWSHLVELRNDLEKLEIAAQVLPPEKRTGELENLLTVIWNEHPGVLDVAASGVDISDQQRDALIQALRDTVDADRRFAKIRRFLEIIDAGNRTNRFRMRIPYIPAPVPSQSRSPFRQIDFEIYANFKPVQEAFEQSLGKQGPLSVNARWGQVMFSALVYGGLLKANWLLSLPDALERAETGMRWLYLKPVSPKEDEAPPEPRRWFPDPLTRFLLIRMRKDRLFAIESSARADYQHVMKLLRAYAAERKFLGIFPKGLRAISAPAITRMHFNVRPWLVAYATGAHSSTSLPEWSWDRLIHPPTQIASELTPRERTRARNRRKDDVEDELAEDDADIPVQLRELGSEILKGDIDLLKRINAWRVREDPRLLPSVRLLSEWLCKKILTGGAGRKARRYRTAYQAINAGGSRLAGQLGAIDPLQVQDEAVFIEWYKTAIEDAPSTAVRRKVANVLRSFHAFLVEKNGGAIPDLDDSDVFAVTGKNGGLVDANIIGLDTFFRATVYLRQIATEKYDRATANDLSLIASSAYFGNMRRSEVLGLRLSDVESTGDFCVLVRPHMLRSLKTRSGYRMIPLSLLMPNVEAKKFMKHVQKRRRETNDPDAWLFPDYVGITKLKDNSPKLILITEALQRAADDETLRFHHLRHSFATWLLLRLLIAELGGADCLPQWFLPTKHDSNRWEISDEERKWLLGDAPTARRGLLLVSLLLGHSVPDITLASYIHLADFMLGLMVRRLAPYLSNEVMGALSGRTPEYVARLRNRLKPKLSDADNVNAELLTWLCDNEPGAGSTSKNIETIDKVNFSERPTISLPDTPFLFVLHYCAALEACGRMSMAEVVAEYQIDAKVLTGAKQKMTSLHTAPACETDAIVQQPKAPQTLTIDSPKGPMQTELARRTIETAVGLYRGLIEDQKVGAVMAARRIDTMLEKFPGLWVPGTYLTLRFDSTVEAKTWCWFLTGMGLAKGIKILHIPGKGKDFPAVARQRKYWADNLNVEIEKPDNKKKTNIEGAEEQPFCKRTRGMIYLSIDLRQVPKEQCGFNKVTGLPGVIWALVGMRLIGMGGIPFAGEKKEHAG